MNLDTVFHNPEKWCFLHPILCTFIIDIHPSILILILSAVEEVTLFYLMSVLVNLMPLSLFSIEF